MPLITSSPLQVPRHVAQGHGRPARLRRVPQPQQPRHARGVGGGHSTKVHGHVGAAGLLVATEQGLDRLVAQVPVVRLAGQGDEERRADPRSVGAEPGERTADLEPGERGW